MAMTGKAGGGEPPPGPLPFLAMGAGRGDRPAAAKDGGGIRGELPPPVLLLSAAHPPTDTRVVRKEGAALARAGHRVLHLCPADAGAPASLDGVEILTHALPRVRGLPALARRAAALRPAVIHASEPDAWLAALLAARRCGARVVLDVHEHYPSRLDARLPRPLRPLARALIAAACRAMGRAADAVVVAKDGLDGTFAGARIVPVRNYAPAPVAPPRAHRPGPLVLGHLGALTRARGWPCMLEALARCAPATRLLLIGRFTDGSEDAFRARAAALGLADRVEVTGWLPQHEALARLRDCDVALVLFQRGEENHRLALPHKLFDAMAAGLPVIAPAFAEEVASVVRRAGCGLLVDSGDPAAVASAIGALADPGRRAALGEAGSRAARDAFAWEREAARLLALYRGLMDAEPPPGAAAPRGSEARVPGGGPPVPEVSR